MNHHSFQKTKLGARSQFLLAHVIENGLQKRVMDLGWNGVEWCVYFADAVV
jgi:hypothetical protein